MGALDGRVAIITGAGPRSGPRARAAVRERRRQGRRQRPRRRHARRGRRPELGDADRRRHQGDGRRGGRQRRQRRRLGRRAAHGATGGRRVRRPAHPREQRRHPARPRDHQHDRSRVGRGDRRAPEGPLLPDPPRGRVLAGADQGGQGRERVDRAHVVDVGAVLESRARPTTARPRRGIATLSQICAKELVALRRALERDRARRPHPPHRGDARAVGGREGARGRLRRVGPGATCRRSSRTSPPPTARSPARRFIVQGGTVQRVAVVVGAPRRSRRTTAGRSPSSRPRARSWRGPPKQ